MFTHLKCDNNQPLADTINESFVSCTANIPPLNPEVLSVIRNSLGPTPDDLIVSEYSVDHALSKLKCNKSTGPDQLPNLILKSIADVLASPLCAIINSSIRTGTVPLQWKLSRVSPIPKCHPPVHIESDLRPIAVTSSLSKVAESFICQYFNSHF